MGKIKFADTAYQVLSLWALFSINIYNGAECCPALLETVGIHVPIPNIRNFSMFSCSSTSRPSGSCASAADSVCIAIDNFRNSCLNVNNLH
jgi:hypothetical protein